MSEIVAAVFDGAASAARVLERLRAQNPHLAPRFAEACALRREADGRMHLEESLEPQLQRRLPHGFWQRLLAHLLAREEAPRAHAERCLGRAFCETVAHALGPDRSAIFLELEANEAETVTALLAREGARVLRAPVADGAALAHRLEEALIEVPTALELAATAEAVETQRLRAAQARARAAEEVRRRELERQRAETLSPADLAEIVRRCAETARRGGTRLIALTFPAELLEDRGRRISQGEPDWPQSLIGRARAFYRFWQERLAPLGYRLEAKILAYEEGVPSTVGLILDWSRPQADLGLKQPQEPLGGHEIAS